MSLTNAISSSETSLKLSKKIVETLSEKFGFKFESFFLEDFWTSRLQDFRNQDFKTTLTP